MSKILQRVLEKIPNIGDVVKHYHDNVIVFDNNKEFISDTPLVNVNIGDKIIRAHFDLDEKTKEIYIWIQFSSLSSVLKNDQDSILKFTRLIKLESI